MIVALAAVGAASATSAVEGFLGAGLGLVLLLLFAIQWLYFASLEAWRGSTPGKSALGLRVVTVTGRPIGLGAAVLRNVLRAADALPLTYSAGLISIAGLTSMSLTRRFQRLGDLVAGTIVVVHERARAATPLVLAPAAQPHEVEALASGVTLDADELQAIELFLRHRARFGREREIELARMIAPALGERFGLPSGGAASAGLGSDPSRTLALLYDRAVNAGRSSLPPSSGTPGV
jgi:uncharacterized RDD family membrane protein YckC